MKPKLLILLLILTQILTAQTLTEMTGTPFDDVWYGSIAFSDVNGDGRKDVLITGGNGSEGYPPSPHNLANNNIISPEDKFP
jgi:hypothetical protein